LTKIRLVAVTLLDAVPAQAYDDPSVQGMAAYLLGEFLEQRRMTKGDFRLITYRFPEHHDVHRRSIRRLNILLPPHQRCITCIEGDNPDYSASYVEPSSPRSPKFASPPLAILGDPKLGVAPEY
jgi:hypothetical protein